MGTMSAAVKFLHNLIFTLVLEYPESCRLSIMNSSSVLCACSSNSAGINEIASLQVMLGCSSTRVLICVA